MTEMVKSTIYLTESFKKKLELFATIKGYRRINDLIKDIFNKDEDFINFEKMFKSFNNPPESVTLSETGGNNVFVKEELKKEEI